MRLLVVLSVACCATLARPPTVYEKTADFSKFRALLDLDLLTLRSLYNDEATVFAPVEAAFRKFRREPLRNLASYHVAEGVHVFSSKSDGTSLRSVGEGNPPLWITVRHPHVYVNNALVLTEEFTYSSLNEMNRSQILYAVDEVLDPMVSDHPNPTALDFLTRTPQQWNANHTSASFLSDVIQNHLEDFFDDGGGKYTFFIPVDDGEDARLNIDAIKAHVVPNRVLFTRPSERDYWFPTLAAGDYAKVFVSMDGEDSVVAETAGETNETSSRVTAEIVFGNVPLRNGVAHLISEPLSLFARSPPSCELIDAFSASPNLNTSYFLGVHSGFNEDFNLPSKFTLFAPSNAAWDSLGDKFDLFGDAKRPESAPVIRRILQRHLVVGDIPVALETLEKSAGKSCAKLKTAGEGRVCLGARKSGAEYEVTWGGITAHVSRVNYECADGLMHVIDAPLVDDADFDELEPKISVDFVKIWRKLKDLL